MISLQVQAGDRRFLGEVVGRVYHSVRGPGHFFRKFEGYGISKEVLDRLLELGVQRVILDVRDVRGGRVRYESRLMDWVAKGFDFTDCSGMRPDPQLVLPLKLMQEVLA